MDFVAVERYENFLYQDNLASQHSIYGWFGWFNDLT